MKKFLFVLFIIVFFVLTSCWPDISTTYFDFLVHYTVEYVNACDSDIKVRSGCANFWSDLDSLSNTAEKAFKINMDNHSEGLFIIDWSYTSYSYAQEPFQDRGDAISSFFLTLKMPANEYIISGWPEELYQEDNIISYGNGWGFGASSIGLIHEGELLEFDFPYEQYGWRMTNVYAKARLLINEAGEISFELTELPHLKLKDS